jgi:hypothetical protein
MSCWTSAVGGKPALLPVPSQGAPSLLPPLLPRSLAQRASGHWRPRLRLALRLRERAHGIAPWALVKRLVRLSSCSAGSEPRAPWGVCLLAQRALFVVVNSCVRIGSIHQSHIEHPPQD